MANRKNCIKCGRGIDEFARVCPYCSWWQSQPVPAQQPVAAPVEQVTQNDPRSITGSPYETPSPRPARPRVVAAVEMQPIPVFQPVPHVRVNREATAQLALLVGTDGRVHDIDVQRDVPGVMGPLIGEVQQCRFRPATQNGQAVSSRFTVAVTFRP